MGAPLYRVGQLARAAGVNPRTVDYYTRIGLLQPEARTESRYRLYSEASLQRLRTIQALRRRGWTLDEVRAALDRGPSAVVAEAARLQSELERLLGAVGDLKGVALDGPARAALTALAVKGMALAQQLLLVLSEQTVPPL